MLKNINILCLILSIIWMITSSFDFEPIIVTLGFVGVLFFTVSISKKNIAKINGNQNILNQENTSLENTSCNEVDIRGNNNNIVQKN